MAILNPTGRNLLSDTAEFLASTSTTGVSLKGTSAAKLDGTEYEGCKVRSYAGTFQAETGLTELIYYRTVKPAHYGDAYTFSFYAKGEGRFRTYFYGPPGYVRIKKYVSSDGEEGDTGDGSKIWTLTKDWERYWITYYLDDSGGDLSLGKYLLMRHDGNLNKSLSISLAGLKLEYGDTATPWTPAPEDSLSGGGTNMILAFDVITLATVTDVQGIYRFYQLATSKPSKPTTYPPASAWSDEMPGYQLGNQDSLYFVDVTVFNDLTYQYGEVQLSTDYEAVKATYADALQQIANAEKQMQSEIQKTNESIRAEVSEDYYKKDQTDDLLGTISTALEQTKDSFTMQFNSFQADLENVNADNSAKFQELYQYIRFKGGSIELGETGNTITLTIENDRISFKQAGQEIAYMSNNQLSITDANIVTSLRIGNFIFSPRPNGSLDFKKVGA